jgi:hypothetical protein
MVCDEENMLAINYDLLFCHQTPVPKLQENDLWCGQLLNPAETTSTVCVL